MMDVVRTTMLAALTAAAIALPSVAAADPPAAEPPHAPPVFQGAPTTQGQQGGAFTLNFDDLGRFEGVGRAPEPPRNIDLTPGRERRQAGSLGASATNAATDKVFLSFLRQLRNVDNASR
ncbi:MAG: hypothetical protein GIX01_06575 [Candidatus Eremiobacteraeota bacterium]|nr:hypothetical protein [Candidatus Eremiobacteraeota bacterium]